MHRTGGTTRSLYPPSIWQTLKTTTPQVYKAYHQRTNDVVAIKAISRDKLNRKLQKNLEQEISIMQAQPVRPRRGWGRACTRGSSRDLAQPAPTAPTILRTACGDGRATHPHAAHTHRSTST